MTVLAGAPVGLLQAPDRARPAVFRGFGAGTVQVVNNCGRSAIEYRWHAHALARAPCVSGNRLLESLLFNGYSGVVARHGPAWADVGTPTLAEEPSRLLSQDHAALRYEGPGAGFCVGLKFWGIARGTDEQWVGLLTRVSKRVKHDG